MAVATDCRSGKTVYFEKGKCRDILSAIKASASMPYVSPMVASEHVTVKRVEGNMDKLGDLYWLGYEDAKRQLFSLNKYLN